MSTRILSGLFVVLFGLASRVSASGPIFVVNPSFENPSCGAMGPAVCVATGWTSTGMAFAFLPPANAWDTIPDGSQVAFSNGGTLTEILAANITADTEYTLSLFVSQRWTAGSSRPRLNCWAAALCCSR